MRGICLFVFVFHCSLDGGVWSLRNLSISVPRAVLSGEGRAALLRCSYDLEGAALYSIRWYRAEDEFYRYVPREMPPTMVFPLPGASVDLAQSDHQQVRIVNMNRRLSGDYQCEVSADAPLFHTDIRSAPLTVVDPPFRAPRLLVSRLSYARNDLLQANCSVDEAYPAPNITWTIDGHKIAETISWQSPEQDFKERGAFSQLEVSVVESLQYGGERARHAGHSGDGEHFAYRADNEPEKREVLRYTLSAPASGQFALGCVATIYDVYARGSEQAHVREDSPRPASVTGEDSSGIQTLCSFVLTCVCACVALLRGL
ncbi:PREDICTED: uncharacterized protein LOC106111320 [Papilio polytes]|uniref:uncharacterized protein LOC106111320 n=1 Tax=Papilio polytes TaxID=76194 RepID=UPI000676A34B|nr:PREDICTED: uncharacterized protein LOC106111320 [Papilio polytes]